MRASTVGIFMGISMAFSLRKEGKVSTSSASISIVAEVLTILILSLPTFL